MGKKLAIPERYDIWQQDLTKSYLCLTFMGFVRTQSEARNMLQVFNCADKKEVEMGHHAYFFSCGKLKNVD